MDYYIIEYEDSGILTSVRFKATTAIEALSKFYAQVSSKNDIGVKYISRADTIKEAIELFHRLGNIYYIYIANIYTLGDWIYCTEKADDSDEN